MAEYEIIFKREVLNSTLHIIAGALLSFILVPVYSIWIVSITNFVFGSLREYLQFERDKIQPFYIIVIDVMGWVVGGLLWFFIRNYFNINVDLL